MATKALTAVASRARRPIAPARRIPSHSIDWRDLLIRQDVEALWDRLSALVRLVLPDSTSEHDAITQEIFLHLLTSEKFQNSRQRKTSGKEIYQEIQALIASLRR